jgi:hypothetical protein
MKTYLSDIIPTIKSYSKKLDDVTILKNVHWKLIDEDSGDRIVYIFRDENELLISKNGEVDKGRWEYLGNDSLLIEISDKAYLFKQGFYNDYVLGLKKDGVNEYAVMIDENKIEGEIRSLEDLSYISRLLRDESSSKKAKSSEGQTIKEATNNTESTDDNIHFWVMFFWFLILGLVLFTLVKSLPN